MPASDILSSADVAELRALVQDLSFPDHFEVRRETQTPDNAGGHTTTTTTVAAGPCRLREIGGGSERLFADRLGWQQPYAVDLPPTLDLKTSDDLLVNGRAMEVGAVVRGGVWALTITAIVQERG
jgi:hypothetical protein